MKYLMQIVFVYYINTKRELDLNHEIGRVFLSAKSEARYTTGTKSSC